jgi:hypothetical protein
LYGMETHVCGYGFDTTSFSPDRRQSTRYSRRRARLTLCLWCFRCKSLEKGTFIFEKIPRKNFWMYPEDALGGGVQSASIMWERVESLFQGIRDVMQKNGNSRSGSFSMPWTAACMTFIEVRSPLTLNCMRA